MDCLGEQVISDEEYQETERSMRFLGRIVLLVLGVLGIVLLVLGVLFIGPLVSVVI